MNNSSTVLLLFNPDDYADRKVGNKIEFIDAVRDFAFPYINLVDAAFAKTKEHLAGLSRLEIGDNGYPGLMNSILWASLITANPTICYTDKNKRNIMRRSGFNILFKKLGEGLKPSNVRTKNAEALKGQKSIDGADDLPVVHMGYTIDPHWNRITGYWITYIKNGKTVWSANIEDIVENKSTRRDIQITGVAEQAEPKFKGQPKEDRKAL